MSTRRGVRWNDNLRADDKRDSDSIGVGMIAITLLDSFRRESSGLVTVAEVAQSISAGLAKTALVDRADG